MYITDHVNDVSSEEFASIIKLIKDIKTRFSLLKGIVNKTIIQTLTTNNRSITPEDIHESVFVVFDV